MFRTVAHPPNAVLVSSDDWSTTFERAILVGVVGGRRPSARSSIRFRRF